jgi:hypothetical protein
MERLKNCPAIISPLRKIFTFEPLPVLYKAGKNVGN